MNDLYIPQPGSTDRRDSINRKMADLTRASASSHALLDRHPSLRERACELLLDALKEVDLASVCGVSSPDAIFLNHLDNNGRIHSVAMSDLLVDAMRHGGAVVAKEGAAFFTRHDSIGPKSAVPYDVNRQLKDTVAQHAPILPGYYRSRLLAPWNLPDEDSEDPSANTQAELMAEQHRHALQCEVALRGFSATLSPDEQKRLTDVFDSGSTEGVFSLAWMTAHASPVNVLSSYVVTEAGQESEPRGAVFLVMPARGIERFDSTDLLRQALSGRLADVVKDLMLIRDQLHLNEQEIIEPDAWFFEPLSGPLIDAHVQAVEYKQTNDCNFLLTREGDDTDRSTFYAELDRMQTCAHLDDAMGYRFNALTAEMNEILQPHWRKYANEEQKAGLLRLEQTHEENLKKVDSLFSEVASIEEFSYKEITRFISQYLGRFVDPHLVQITFHDSIKLGGEEALAATYQKSLMQFALLGLPDSAGSMIISPSPDQIHVDFSPQFVKGMLDLLDLPRRYEQELNRIAADDHTMRVMAHHRDSAIAMGAFAARIQGHLQQDRSLDLIHEVRGDVVREDAALSIGSLYLSTTHTRFKDVIVFEEKTSSDEHYVLYAPGAPNGRDFYEFSTWRQLSVTVGGWLASEVGRTYVHGQLSGPSQRGVVAVLSNTQLKPSTWSPESCMLMRSAESNYESCLCALVRQSALRELPHRYIGSVATGHVVTPTMQALTQARIEALSEEFARLSPGLISLRDYVHRETDKMLNDFLRGEGYRYHVDPDTWYFGLGADYTDTPDFSELPSLTDLMMYGSEDLLSYAPKIHVYSSDGLKIGPRPVLIYHVIDRWIREADLGARYMNYLVDQFLAQTSPLYERRKHVFAQRLHHEMIRGAMKGFVSGELSEAQYSWLRRTINAFSGVAPADLSTPAHAVSLFTIDSQVVEGVYIFRDFTNDSSAYELLYTPGAPDGRDFRALSDYAELLDTSAMRNYFHSRVAHSGLYRVEQFMAMIYSVGKYRPEAVKINHWSEYRVPNAGRLYGDMIERMVADTDSLTVSLAEKRLALAWSIIKWTGTILLFPFPHANFAWGIITSSVGLIEAVNVYTAGDRATGLVSIVWNVICIVGSIGGIPGMLRGELGLVQNAVSDTAKWAWNKANLSIAYRLAA